MSPDDWATESQSNRTRNQNRGALGYVAALKDPKGRWYNFHYQTYYRKGYHQNPDAVQLVNGEYNSPNKFHIPFRRISEIQYPEGKKSTFVYWEDANPLPPNDGTKCYTGTASTLEDVYLKFLDNTGPDGKPYNMYLDSSPYLCDSLGVGGIGRDPYFTNIVYQRTVYNGAIPIRRDRFNFDWFNYNAHSMPSWSGDQGLEYEDIYYSENTLFAYENNNWEARKRTKFTYRQAPYKNRSYYSPDVGRKILLKSVKNYDGLSSTPFDTVGYVYNREPAYPSTDYHFRKVREKREVNGLLSGISTWSYTMAQDSMNFSRIEVTDPFGRLTVTEFLTDYIPLNDSASITMNTFYENNLTQETWIHPDSQALNDTLILAVNSYYSDREKSEFKYLTTVWYLGADSLFKAYSDTFYYQTGELLVSYQNLTPSSPSQTYTASEGEIYHQPHIGFENSFPDTLTSLENISSVKLKFYVYYVLNSENTRLTEIYEITTPWDPYDPEYPMISVSSVPLTTVNVDSEGWYEIDLTSQYNAWKNDPENSPFYGVRFTIPPDDDSTTFAYKIRRDQYYPQLEETMIRLEVLINNGADTLLYTTYSGYKSPFAGAPGQLKSTLQKNFSQGIAGKQQSFLYNVLAGGNLYQVTDNNGNRVQYFTDIYNIQGKVVQNGGQAFDTLFSRVYNPNVPPETRVYPDPDNSSEYLNIISLVDAYGVPLYSIDANNIFYEYRGDKLNRITKIVYPYDFQGRQLTAENTTENYSTKLLLKSRHNEDNDVWYHFAYITSSNFQVGRSYDPVRGSFDERAYMKFSDLDSLNITNVVSAKLWVYCNTVGNLSNGYILRLASVQDQWDENYNNSQGSPAIGAYGTSTTNDLGIQPGWNRIDISSWFENYYNINERDNGLCLYPYQTIPTNPGNENDYFEFSYEGDFAPKLEITATFSKWIDPGYTLKMEYHDSTNRLIAFNKQAMPDSVTIINSKSESLYDGLGRITETRAYYDDANYYAALTGYTYADQVDSVRNANGHTTYNDYDFLNRLTRTTFADGNTTRKGYGYTNTLGAAYSPVSNADHFLNEIPAGTFFEVDTTIDELGRIKLSYSDAVGNLRQEIVDPGGLNLVTNYYYNALYQQVRVEKPEGDEVRYRYNSFGELLRRESPDAGVVEYHYDPNGNLRFSQDANLRAAAKVLFTGYDGLNRPTVAGIAAGTDSAAFAALRGDSTYTFEGDTANWISVNRYDKTPDPAAYPWNQYDITGVTGQMRNLKGRITANGFRSGAGGIADNDTLTGQYGSAATFTARNTLTTGNPFETTAPNGNVTLKAGQKITLKPGFHAQGGSRFTAAIDTALQNAPQSGKKWQLELYSYDYRGRVEKKWVFRDGLPQITYSYEYNSQNALTKTTVQVGAENFYHFYEYDRLGQLVKVYTSTDGNKPAQADVEYTYNPVGAVDTLRYGEQPGGGFTVELPYQYNLREWLTDIGNVGSASLPFNASYTYFANGNIQESEYRNSGSPMEQRYKYAYSYDNANRLLSADYQYYSGSWQNPARFDVSGLQYDGNGNILELVRKKEDNTTIDNLTYAYIAGTNKLQSVTDAVGVTNEDWDAESSTFAYDGNGNVIEMLENGQPAISSITYDHRNLPVSLITRNGDVVTYRYNASGQRIFKQVGSQTAEHYILDGDQTVAVFENGAVKYWNILANGVVGRRDASGEKLYYLKDHLGSTRAVVDGACTMKEAVDYYPFGLLMPGRIYQSGSETREKFTGKERDSETGLDYFGARYYWAAGGRWWSVDPLYEKYPSFSSYIYAANNPIFFIDPDGRILSVSGDSTTVANVLQYLSGLSATEFSKRYSVQNGVVNLDLSNLDLSSSEGLKLLAQLITSKKNFQLELRPVTSEETAGLGVINESETPRNPWSKAGELPAGAGGRVVVGTNVQWLEAETGLEILLENIVFHELAENYSRTQRGRIYGVGPEAAKIFGTKPYQGAHWDAIRRHRMWVIQGKTFLPIPQGQRKKINFK